MALRDLLLELIGAEVQEHTVKIGAREKAFKFRQITDAEGREVFAPGPDDESNQDRAKRVMARLVAYSMLGPDGKAAGTVAEAEALPSAVLAELFNAAAKTNNIATAEMDDVSQETPAVPADGGESPSPKG